MKRIKRSVMPQLYTLNMQTGQWEEDIQWCTIMISDDKKILTRLEKDLFDAIMAGYEETKQFFSKHSINITNLPLDSEDEFNEFFRGEKFTTSIDKFKYIFGTGLYTLREKVV